MSLTRRMHRYRENRAGEGGKRVEDGSCLSVFRKSGRLKNLGGTAIFI